MRIQRLARLTALVAASTAVVFGCAQLAGLDDSTSGSSGTSSSKDGGKALSGEVEISPATLEFLPTECGTEAVKPIVLVNKSNADVDYNIKSNDAVFVIKGNPKGTMISGGSATIDVAVRPTLAQLQKTDLVIEINGRTQIYPANVQGQGATFELSQTAIDFGDVRKQNGAETKISVKNAGNKPLAAVLEPVAPTTDFEVVPRNINAAIDGSAEVTVRLKDGVSTAAPIAAQFKPNGAGICGAQPILDVRGKRITTDVTIDTVDWGDVLCKSTPADRDATVKNYGPSSVSFTSTLTGTLFSIKTGGTGTLLGGSETNPTTAKIKLSATPGTVPGQKDETLTITYASGAQTSTGKVREYVAGLVLQITPNSAAFSSDGGTEQRRKFDITNNAGRFGGYISINADYQATGAGFRTENGTGSYQPAFLVFPPTTGSVDVVFKATGPAPVNGNLLVTGAVCSQTTVALTGTNP